MGQALDDADIKHSSVVHKNFSPCGFGLFIQTKQII